MKTELAKLIRCVQLQAALDGDEYVQQYNVRSSGPPEAIKGRQTQQKLEQIVKKCRVAFTGKSFLDLGCNKGFFPLYAGAVGAVRAVGIDPDPVRVKRASDIAAVSGNLATFECDKFRLSMVERYGVFDIVYVGSAYHYFWLDHRSNKDARDHDAIFETLAKLSADVLIFEGCTSLDDEQWRLAALRMTGSSEAEIRAEFNNDVIMSSAGRYFDIENLGSAGHAEHRFLFLMTKKRHTEASPPKSFAVANVVSVVGKRPEDSAGTLESVSVVEVEGNKFIKKVLSAKRGWCMPAIGTFERVCKSQMAYPRGLVRHHSFVSSNDAITMFQEYLPDPLYTSLDVIRHRNTELRQRLAYFMMYLERDLLTAGLIHMDIHETNVFVSDADIRVVDFEGLIVANSDLYRSRFAKFYTLNFIALLEIIFDTGVRRVDFQSKSGVELYGGSLPDDGVNSVLGVVRPPNDEVRAIYETILRSPEVLTNIGFYDLLLRALPPAIASLNGGAARRG